VVRQVGGCGGLAIAAQVRAHDPVAGARESGSDPSGNPPPAARSSTYQVLASLP
jgi:hypothetical protein